MTRRIAQVFTFLLVLLASCGPSSAPASDAGVDAMPRPRTGFGNLSPQGGTITSVLPTSGGGLAGGGTSGAVTLGLIASCGTGQGLTWSGTAWACTGLPTGSGTTNDLVKWTGSTTLGNSSAADNGTTFSISNENVQSIRAVGAGFTSANPSWDGFDTTAMAQGVGGSIIFEGNYTSGGSHTAFGAIKAVKDNATSGDFGADLSFGARQNGSGDSAELMRLVGPNASILMFVPSGLYVQDSGTPTDALRLVAASGQSYLESGTSASGGSTQINFTGMNGSILYGQFGTFGATVTPNVTSGGGIQAALRIGGQSTISTAGDAMAITFEQDTGGNYFTRILSENTATSPSFLNPELVFQVQGAGTNGLGNLITEMTVASSGVTVAGASGNNSLTVNQSFTGQTVGTASERVNSTGSFDTTAGSITDYAVFATNTATRSAGANTLVNIGVYTTASGAQSNQALVADSGDVVLNLSSGSTTDDGMFVSSNATAGAERIKFIGKDVLGNTDNTNGPELWLGLNSTNRRDIMLVDSGANAVNGTNLALDFGVGTSQGIYIQGVSTNWGSGEPIKINPNGGSVTIASATQTTAIAGPMTEAEAQTAQAVDVKGVTLTDTATFNTTSAVRNSYGLYVSAANTISSGSNTLTTIAGDFTNTSAGANIVAYALLTESGNNLFNQTSGISTFANGASGINGYGGKHYEWNDDWLNITSSTSSPSQIWLGSQYQIQSSGAVAIKNTPAQGHPGVVSWDIGTTTAGSFGSLVVAPDIDFTAGNYTYEWVGGFPTLSSSSNASATEYISLVGFWDTTANVPNQIDGCFFAYDKGNVLTSGTNTTNLDIWECWCASNGTRTTFKMDGSTVSNESFTTVNEPVAALTYPNTNIYHLKVVMTGTTRAEFYVNGTKSCDINTNIPSGIVRATGAGFGIWSEASTGTGSRQIDTDYTSLQYDMTSARSP